MTQEGVSRSGPNEHDVVPGKVSPPDKTTSTSSSMNSTSTVKVGVTNTVDIKEPVAYYPLSSSAYSYPYSGFDGMYSKWNDTAYFVPQEGFPMHFPQTLQQRLSAQHVGEAMGYHLMGRSSLFYNQGQAPQFPRNLPENFRSTSHHADNTRMGVHGKYNQRRHPGEFHEIIHGPRADGRKDPSNTSDEKSSSSLLTYEFQYNLPDFQTKYEHAKFFMIKSYNEDDVHKSIKYNVWASTASGNKKLNDAFQLAENIFKETSIKCPIFLFFSVNTSGKFLGIAEMVGQVDFKKSMDFWQEERWSGFFPLQWHIVKDVPNINFKNITLPNNDNRLVYYSRDTQEIPLLQGLEMLKIFKYYNAENSILEDFGFYDIREKSLRAKRSCIPSLVRSEVDKGKTFDDMDSLDEAMKEMQLSALAAANPHLM